MQILQQEIFSAKKVGIFLASDPNLSDCIGAYAPKGIAVFERQAGGEPWCRRNGRINVQYRGLETVARNNLDTLVLTGAAVQSTRRLKYFGHASYIVIPLNLSLIYFVIGFLRYFLRGKIFYTGIISEPRFGKKQWWFVFKTGNPIARRGPTFFVSPFIDAKELFSRLAGLNYCMLRYFRDLDDLDKLSDIDLLVDDRDFLELIDRLDQDIGLRLVDVSTVHGTWGRPFRGVAYFPPMRSKEMLERAIIGPYGERRPAPKDAFLSYGYHLVFHKGLNRWDEDGNLGEHSWSEPKRFIELCRLADEAQMPRPRALSELEELLRSEGWFPARDKLGVLASYNAFIKARYFADEPRYKPGLGVFVVREVAERYGVIQTIEDSIRAAGFNIIASGSIERSRRPDIAEQIRGGNWAKMSGFNEAGGPAYYIITFDPNPIRRRGLRRLSGRLDNARMLLKEEIRKKIGDKVGIPNLNVIHASDNSSEALNYISILDPMRYENCRSLVE